MTFASINVRIMCAGDVEAQLSRAAERAPRPNSAEVLIIKCKTDQTDIETIETIHLMFSFPISKFAEWLCNEGREGYANETMPKTQVSILMVLRHPCFKLEFSLSLYVYTYYHQP